jgi:hypothetical protein
MGMGFKCVAGDVGLIEFHTGQLGELLKPGAVFLTGKTRRNTFHFSLLI